MKEADKMEPSWLSFFMLSATIVTLWVTQIVNMRTNRILHKSNEHLLRENVRLMLAIRELREPPPGEGKLP